ncbi:MAG: CpsD/CapB family tyrosine-protein kinase [Planctomycetes bacterium]|nr:CpsD/CapB family tyrosine-protein kinase [Planctomycetota bacterium]
MGRILDALKQSGGNRPRATETSSKAGPGGDRPASEASQEIPFIEVGGAGVILEASPGILKAGTGKSLARPKVEARPSMKVLPFPPQAPESVSAPLTLTFQPVPAGIKLPTPRERLAADLVAFHQPEHPSARLYQSLVEQITAQIAGQQSRVLLFTAAASGTNKTTVLLNLAITWARQQSGRIVAVDAGAGRPGMAQRLGLPGYPGLREVLRGKLILEAALQETGLPNLHALTAGEGEKVWPSGEVLKAVLRELRQRFDLVLVDAPAWDGGPDLVALALGCDAVYLFLRQVEVHTAEVEALLQAIPRHGPRLGGCIVTNS